MSFQIRPATRTGVKPLVGLYSESGCGKTYSSLLLARGLAGTSGRIVMVDTESGRGELYADVIPGSYETIRLDEPFSPARYVEAITVAEQSGAACIVVDSMSHEWEGPSGVLDMAGDNEQRSGRPGLHNWKNPKLEHAKLVLKLLRSTVPIVCCIRAKYKSRQVKGTEEMAKSGAIRDNQIGKTVILKDDFTSPIQAEDFIFEMTIHGEIMANHSFRLTKCSHPDLRKCFPDGEPITIQHGIALAKWCDGGAKPAKSVAALKKELWKVTEAFHMGSKEKLLQWLIDEAILTPEQTLDSNDPAFFENLILQANKRNDVTP